MTLLMLVFHFQRRINAIDYLKSYMAARECPQNLAVMRGTHCIAHLIVRPFQPHVIKQSADAHSLEASRSGYPRTDMKSEKCTRSHHEASSSDDIGIIGVSLN